MKNIQVNNNIWKRVNSTRKQYNYKTNNDVIKVLFNLYDAYESGTVVDAK
jgi:hypothetical protein